MQDLNPTLFNESLPLVEMHYGVTMAGNNTSSHQHVSQADTKIAKEPWRTFDNGCLNLISSVCQRTLKREKIRLSKAQHTGHSILIKSWHRPWITLSRQQRAGSMFFKVDYFRALTSHVPLKPAIRDSGKGTKKHTTLAWYINLLSSIKPDTYVITGD